MWRFPMVSEVVAGLVRWWFGFDGGFCASFGLVSSLSRSTTVWYKINASSKLGHNLVGVR